MPPSGPHHGPRFSVHAPLLLLVIFVVGGAIALLVTRYVPVGCAGPPAAPVCYVMDRWSGSVEAQRTSP